MHCLSVPASWAGKFHDVPALTNVLPGWTGWAVLNVQPWYRGPTWWNSLDDEQKSARKVYCFKSAILHTDMFGVIPYSIP